MGNMKEKAIFSIITSFVYLKRNEKIKKLKKFLFYFIYYFLDSWGEIGKPLIGNSAELLDRPRTPFVYLSDDLHHIGPDDDAFPL